MALHVRRKRGSAGRLRGSGTAPGMAQAGRSGLLRQRILEDRVSRRVELVSRTGHFVARHAVSDRTQAAAADVVCRRNPVVEFARSYVDNLEKSVPNLWSKVLLPGVGHWTEQEAPTEVNRLMVDFLVSMDGTGAAK
jgi:pimeloyl-ACP methyl ester carboxylesterase